MSVSVSVPGRIEVLGNHTDYNGGRVLVAPTRKAVRVEVRAVRERLVTVTSAAFPKDVSQDIAAIHRARGPAAWANHVLGAVRLALTHWPRRGGLRIRVSGDLPIGAGLASSAALSVATLRALARLSGRRPAVENIAAWALQVENEFVGVPVGPLDPISGATARRGQLTRLDFAGAPRFEHVPMPHGWRILVFDTGTRHVLRATAYAQRRAECAEAAKAMGVARLGLLSPAQFHRRAADLPAILRKRARHVVEESARVAAAMKILSGRRDASAIGALLDASQRSSHDHFENSHPAIDAMIKRLHRLPGVAGARLTGGGFGGAVIAWARSVDLPVLLRSLAADGSDAPRLLDIA